MGYFWTSCCIAVIRHAVSAYNLLSNMKIRERYIKFTGNINNTYIIDKAAIRLYASKTTTAVSSALILMYSWRPHFLANDVCFAL